MLARYCISASAAPLLGEIGGQQCLAIPLHYALQTPPHNYGMPHRSKAQQSSSGSCKEARVEALGDETVSFLPAFPAAKCHVQDEGVCEL